MTKKGGRSDAWTPAEDAYVAANYGSVHSYDISLRLNRTVAAVHTRAYKLHLKAPRRVSAFHKSLPSSPAPELPRKVYPPLPVRTRVSYDTTPCSERNLDWGTDVS